MKNTPKLQDTLEVFLEDLEKLKEQLKGLYGFEPMINSKIEAIKDSKVKLDMAPLRNWKYDFLDSLQSENNKLNALLKKSEDRLEKINAKRKEKLIHFYIYTGVAFLIAVGGMYFGFSTQKELNQLEPEINRLEYYNTKLLKFIKEKEQIEEFTIWLEEK